MPAVSELAADVGVRPACEALHVPRASYYRWQQRAGAVVEANPRPRSVRALTTAEQENVLARLHEERFQDRSPATVFATLLDEGQYHCSIRTMYRLLEKRGESRERRDQLNYPTCQKPELLAAAPNQLWSWDITKLMVPAEWTYFHRYVVGWMVAPRESAELAKRLIRDSYAKQNIQPGELTVHADRGSAMTYKSVGFLMADLGVTKTHSRPYVSDDNPYSESQFRTLKYRPDFPDRFDSIQDARAFCVRFFAWYNEEHRHSALGLMTPGMVHWGQSELIRQQRQVVLDAAYQAHPERFVRKPPSPPEIQQEVWINKPQASEEKSP